MTYYQKLINEIAPDVYAPGVEASMRLQYGTLSHLARETFIEEIALYREIVKEEPDYGEKLARSYGLVS